MSTQKRILIFNVNWLGDVLFSTAAIRNIRYAFPDSHIACIIPSRCAAVLEANPHVNELLFFDERVTHRGLVAKVRFIRTLAGKRFDIVFLFHRSLSRALLCYLAGIPQRIGYRTAKRGFLLTRKVEPPDIHAVHRRDYYLGVLTGAGLMVRDRHPELFLTPEEETRAADFLKSLQDARGTRTVAINPGGNWLPKRWPKEYFARLADILIHEFSSRVIITGSSDDVPLAEGIAALMKGKPCITCGRLNLRQYAAFVKRCDLLVSADSGPLHLADAVGVKNIIALFGPTSPALTGPYHTETCHILQKDTGCPVPCYSADCPDNRCMKAVTVEDVVELIRQKRLL